MLSRLRVPYVIAVGLAVLIVAVAAVLATSNDVVLGREGDDLHVGEGSISLSEAIAAAQSEATGTIDDVEVERRDGRVVYDIEIGNTDVIVDAEDGSIVATRTDNDDDGATDDDAIVDATRLSSAIGVDEAISIARTEADGSVQDVELENEHGRLVYSIEIGQHEVEVDAVDGTVLNVENDD